MSRERYERAVLDMRRFARERALADRAYRFREDFLRKRVVHDLDQRGFEFDEDNIRANVRTAVRDDPIINDHMKREAWWCRLAQMSALVALVESHAPEFELVQGKTLGGSRSGT